MHDRKLVISINWVYIINFNLFILFLNKSVLIIILSYQAIAEHFKVLGWFNCGIVIDDSLNPWALISLTISVISSGNNFILQLYSDCF